MASGSNVDSTRVDGVQLAGEAGQHERSNAQIKTNIPVSPRPPIRHMECPHRNIKWRRRRGRLKFESTKVSQTQNGRTAYLELVHSTQPPANIPKCLHRVHRTHRRRGRIKIESRKVSRMRNGGKTYLGCVNAIQSTWEPKKYIRGFINLPLSAGCRGSLGTNTEDSRSSASASIKHEKTESLTGYTPTLHSHPETLRNVAMESLD